jgi:hypothetical protein
MNEKKGRFFGIKKNPARFHKSKICNSRGVFAKSRKKNKLGKYRLDQTLLFFSSAIITYDNSAGPFFDRNSIILWPFSHLQLYHPLAHFLRAIHPMRTYPSG